MNCNTGSSSMCDCFISWADILGKPELASSLVSFVDAKIEDANGSILDDLRGEIDALVDKLKEELDKDIVQKLGEVDVYKIGYNDTTVGDALDTLFDEEFSGTITPEKVYEKGRKVYDEIITWTYNKPVIKQEIRISHANSPQETIELDPILRNYKIALVTDDTTVVVVGTTEEGSEITLDTKILFKLRMFYGAHPTAVMTNEQILGLNSLFIDFSDKAFTHLFNCQEKDYIYYLFPNGLHMYYNFYSNGLKDNTYLWEVIRVVNQYGYASDYIKFRTPIALTGCDIRSEVYAHEAY